MAEDIRGNDNEVIKGIKPGGWRAIKYILANETFEKLASMSLIANITVYLNTMYNMDGILLVNVVNMWSGSSNISSLAGAFLSDAYLGRFHTLLIGSIASLLGMGTMTLTAAIPQLQPPRCARNSACSEPRSWQLGVLFAALTLLALGSGCIRPCNIAFGADQLDTRTEKGRAQLQRFYNWWYFTFTIALLVALTAVVYIQTNVSWTIGFAIPTACFLFSMVTFLIGCPTYIYHKPRGSIFIDMVKVVTAACRKRRLTLDYTDDTRSFYDPPNDGDLFMSKLSRTNRLRFFDKASLIDDPSEVNGDGIADNSWRLCSVQQVEQLKCLIGCLPVWISGILSLLAMDQQNTFGVLQAIQMNRKVGPHFTVPPAWIGLTSMVALSIWILIYERVLIPLLHKYKKTDDARLSVKQRIRIGIIMSIACMLVAAFVEKQRRQAALKKGSFESPLGVGFLAPQLVLSGLIEAFAAVSIMEFFTTQMPDSMRSIAGSVFFLSLSMASYMSSAVVNIIHSITARGSGMAWLGGHDLNKNRLDYFYFIIAAIGGLNFLYFTSFAGKYIFVSDTEPKQRGTLTRELSYSSSRP
ncbi:hypothetical protein Nepgr_018816 [Nepenthes gracilis]|uniref:Uncharacterized protein n=1 Tax=Nepenthes gracilis TaxID=150966 RepID=A0AAD3SU52_NEPGR|nr:hypothetical protein Nepgr_018816 [Nepenthes gracilis]